MREAGSGHTLDIFHLLRMSKEVNKQLYAERISIWPVGIHSFHRTRVGCNNPSGIRGNPRHAYGDMLLRSFVGDRAVHKGEKVERPPLRDIRRLNFALGIFVWL